MSANDQNTAFRPFGKRHRPYEREEKIKAFTLRAPESFGERLAIAAAERQIAVNAFMDNALTKAE
ncbi:toxin-antitoxin system HicB family antitoxin [Brenneria goodwinii]|uniref:toxin-antitoxin system HicB family antitoxin n=1 Tax=Brenneria goodwinii TaxID=1109412 RepID=UPI0036F3AAB8